MGEYDKTLTRVQLLELRLVDQTLRAARAEHQITATNVQAAEIEHGRFTTSLDLTEDGKYEIVGPVDAATGVVQRKLVAPPEAS